MRDIDPLELRQHATPDDAWVAIDGEVYDLTGFLAQHPGGPVMTSILGTDATARVAGSREERFDQSRVEIFAGRPNREDERQARPAAPLVAQVPDQLK